MMHVVAGVVTVAGINRIVHIIVRMHDMHTRTQARAYTATPRHATVPHVRAHVTVTASVGMNSSSDLMCCMWICGG